MLRVLLLLLLLFLLLYSFFFSQTLDTSMKFFPLTILFDHQKAFFCMRGIPLHDSKIIHAQIIFSIIIITDQLIPIILDMKYMAVLILWISLVSTYKVPGNCHNPCQMHRTPEAAFKKGEKGKLWQSLQKMISKCDLSHILLIYSLSLSLSLIIKIA